MRNYKEMIYCKKSEYGDKFSDESLSQKFVPYFESGERIKIRFSHSEVKSGIVNVTTGWVPCFIPIITSRSLGSSYTLSDKDEIIAVKRGMKYVEVK